MSNVKSLPVNVVAPAEPIVPVVMILSTPVSIELNPFVIEPELRAPTVVKDDVTTEEPNVVDERMSVLFIL